MTENRIIDAPLKRQIKANTKKLQEYPAEGDLLKKAIEDRDYFRKNRDALTLQVALQNQEIQEIEALKNDYLAKLNQTNLSLVPWRIATAICLTGFILSLVFR